MARRSRARKNYDAEQFKKKQITAQQLHWSVVGKKCTMCGAPACLTARVFAPLDGLPVEHLLVMKMQGGGKIPVVNTKFGKFVRVGDAAACASHKYELEIEAAKHPDTWFVEFDRGPNHTNKVQI